MRDREVEVASRPTRKQPKEAEKEEADRKAAKALILELPEGSASLWAVS